MDNYVNVNVSLSKSLFTTQKSSLKSKKIGNAQNVFFSILLGRKQHRQCNKEKTSKLDEKVLFSFY